MSAKELSTAEGFQDYSGQEAKIRDYIVAKLSSYYQTCTYSKISFPLLEKQTFFAREMVGSNPWPGWHPKSLFSIQVKNYTDDYDLHDAIENYVLIPEGTTSLCRWVATEIEKDTPAFDKEEALRLFYIVPCFRNELLKNISKRKKREFTQIGIELMNVSGVKGDIEAIHTLYRSLEKLKFTNGQIRLRISDVRIFNLLIQNHKIPPHIEYRVKDILDRLASLRATDNKLAFEHIHTNLIDCLKEADLNEHQISLWVKIIRSKYLKSNELIELLSNDVPYERIADMVEVLKFFEAMDKHVYCDLTVIRSQEYYTGITFQADILLKHHYINEVAGGGRYDEFVGKFLKRVGVKNKGTVPGTGFALSLERLVHAWELNEKEFEGNIYFFTSANNVDVVIDSENIVEAFSTAEVYRSKNKRAEVYITKSSRKAAESYSKKVKAEFIHL